MINSTIRNLINRAEHAVTSTLNTYAKSTNPQKNKKASLLSFWLCDYMRMIKKEDTFDPHYLKKYKRGDIIQAHLGFNIGSEEGGLHYVIVIGNYNYQSSGTLTVIPLTSKKSTYKESIFNVDLGNTIYNQLTSKCNTAKEQLSITVNDQMNKIVAYSSKQIQLTEQLSKLDADSDEAKKKTEELVECVNELKKCKDSLEQFESDLDTVEKMVKEIEHLKLGSIALVGQITTISKIRIYNPLNNRDTLSGIRVSPSDLNILDAKIKELFTNTK